MTCPRCSSTNVATRNRAYVSAHFSCVRCLFRWRLIRGRVVAVTSQGTDS